MPPSLTRLGCRHRKMPFPLTRLGSRHRPKDQHRCTLDGSECSASGSGAATDRDRSDRSLEHIRRWSLENTPAPKTPTGFSRGWTKADQ
eukprot:2079524-Pyramimonas_sp.AAC.1